MTGHKLKRWVLPLLLASGGALAGMAEQSHRATVAGIDLVTYPTHVKDVVVILGSLPAGDAMAAPGNIAIPTLAGSMLDRGTKALDKFAIAERLDDVGASISFAVGTQSLELRAKCLKKDLPLVMSLIAAELRTPALSAAGVCEGEAAVHRLAWRRRCRIPRAVPVKPLAACRLSRGPARIVLIPVAEYMASRQVGDSLGGNVEGVHREILRPGAFDVGNGGRRVGGLRRRRKCPR